MILPLPWRIMARPAAWLAKKVPLTFTAIVRSKSASLTSTARFSGPETGVVDKDVEPSEPLDDGVHRRRDLADPRHVHLDAHRATTHTLDLGDEVVGRPVTPEPQGDIGTGVGERECDRSTKPTRGARHERCLACQREAGESLRCTSPPSRSRRRAASATAVYR